MYTCGALEIGPPAGVYVIVAGLPGARGAGATQARPLQGFVIALTSPPGGMSQLPLLSVSANFRLRSPGRFRLSARQSRSPPVRPGPTSVIVLVDHAPSMVFE